MDFSLDEQQEMLRKMARDFLAQECPKILVKEMVKDEKGYTIGLWNRMAELGWMGLVIPEKYGGTGGNFLDLVVLLEEMGRACLPGPFFSTVVLGGLTILETGSEEQKKELLPRTAQGKLILTLALTEPSASYTPGAIEVKATAEDTGYVIEGTKLFVPDAHIADYLVCVVRTKEGENPEEGISLFLLDGKSPGINYTLLDTIVGDKQCEVILDKVMVPARNMLGELHQGWAPLSKVLEKATVAKCAEMVGGAQQVLEMTINYAKERTQFGRPIGSFQVIQHYCANMMTDVDGCRFATYQAAWRISEGLSASREVSVAKAWVSEAFRQTTALAHQIHGAIGFTQDHDLPLYFKRAKAWELTFGDAEFHLEKVAQEIGL